MKRNHSFWLPWAMALALAACGGGGSDPAPPDLLAELPASASESTAGMASYMGSLATLPAETREPLAAQAFSPPKPDNSEPEPVDG